MIVLPLHVFWARLTTAAAKNSKHDRCALVPCSHISRYFQNSPTAVGVVGVEHCVVLYWSNSLYAGTDQSLTKSSWIAFILVSCAKSESKSKFKSEKFESKSESEKSGLESDSSQGADSSPTTLVTWSTWSLFRLRNDLHCVEWDVKP